MKKMIFLLGLATTLNSCGLVLGGKITDCQKDKSKTTGKRQIRPAALVGDILLGAAPVNLIVDFATGAIYKPCK